MDISLAELATADLAPAETLPVYPQPHLQRPQAGQHAEEAALAGTVGPHDDDAPPMRHIECQLLHQHRPVRGVQRQSGNTLSSFRTQ